MSGDIIVMGATVLNLVAAVMYFLQGDWPRMGYWIGAFIITGSTLLIGRV